MKKPLIQLSNVHLVYPIYSVGSQSLRNTILNMAVGGRIMRSSRDIVHVMALKGVSFSINEGDRLGVIGHNGSGKTSLLKVLAGIYQTDHGVVSVNGTISSMLDISHGVDLDATGLENIQNLGRMRGLSGKQINAKLPEIVEFSELGGYMNLPMKTYSAGMGMRLLFTFATSFEPDILLLDEWLGAGDSNFVHKASERMESVVGGARAVVLASHSDHLIQRVCNKVLVLVNGSVQYFGDTQEYYAAKQAEAEAH
jgi:ABC-type polysaccharide/polyol phosphate transport system ATPase subunit